jgi:hypothetical protein
MTYRRATIFVPLWYLHGAYKPLDVIGSHGEIEDMGCSENHCGAKTKWPRRAVLSMLASTAAALGLGASFARAAIKLGMVDVDYQQHPKGKERCDNCRVWDPPNHCLSVEGEISPSGWCNIWRRQLKSQVAKVDADGKLTQGDVAYQHKPRGEQRCDNCRVFVAPDGCNSVQGRVSPAGWCNIWRKA